MGNKKYHTIQDFVKEVESKGVAFISLLDKEGNKIHKIPTIRDKVQIECNECHNISTQTVRYVSSHDVICSFCKKRKKRSDLKTFEEFQELLKQEGWEIIDGEDKYENTKSILNAICSNGHQTKTSWNKFEQNHRCKECSKQKQRKHTIESVKKEFEEKGMKLLSTEYIANDRNLRYICKCGREKEITYNNFTKRISGCNNCTKRYIPDQIHDIFEENGCYIISIGEKQTVENELNNYISSKKDFFFLWNPEFVLNSTYMAYICSCSTLHYSTWRLFKKGARCPKCTRKKIENTCLEIYGFINAAKSPQVKAKIVATFQERYGVNAAMQLQEFVDKAKETNKKNHGGVHNLTLPEIRKMSKEAYFFLYGEKFGFYEPHQKKARDITREKYGEDYFLKTERCKEIMFAKYGQEYFANSQKFKEIMMKKYGVEHALHNPDLFEKAMRNAFHIKSYIMPSGKICEIQGYENYALDLLLKQGYKDDDIVTGKKVPRISYTFEDKPRIYYPDIYIKSTKTLIEVKSIWTLELNYDKNITKFQSASLSFNFVLWVFSNKGELIKEENF